MFIGYLRSDFEKSLTSLQKEVTLLDVELLKQTYNSYPQYCFSAYEGNEIIGVISAYAFKEYLYINVFEVAKGYEEVYRRLFDLLVKNSFSRNILLLLENKNVEYLEQFNVESLGKFTRYIHSGEAVAFNFSNSLARQVSSENYEKVSLFVDVNTFSINREKYIHRDCVFSNSLKLATTNGYLHSYVVNKRYIRLSPWVMKDESYIDAEKLLRGVLYYRGLKKLYAYAPKEDKEISDLYRSYKFKQEGIYQLLFLGDKPNIKLENLYAI